MGSAGVSSNGGLSNGVTGSKGEVNSFFFFQLPPVLQISLGHSDWIRGVARGERGRGEGGGQAQRRHSQREEKTSADEEQSEGRGGGGGGDLRAADRLPGQQAVAFRGGQC